MAARLNLRPLQDEEVGEFIRFRLKAAKASPDLFTKDAIQLIELDSKGNRRVIMNLAGNCMDLAVIRQEKLITDELAREVCDQALRPKLNVPSHPASSKSGRGLLRGVKSIPSKCEQNQQGKTRDPYVPERESLQRESLARELTPFLPRFE